MSRLGSAAMARQIADHDKPLPEGWQELGEGAFRKAFLGPDGVCYKRTHVSGEVHNKREWKNYQELRKSMPKGVRLPRMRYFTSCNVIAAKCIRGVTGDELTPDSDAFEVYANAQRALSREGLLYDVHRRNLVVDGPHAYVIDLGENR